MSRRSTRVKRRASDERRYSLQRIIKSVSEVAGIAENEMRQRQHGALVKASRELVCYLARRYGEVSMVELARFLQVKESSTPIRRAEERA